MDFMVGFTGTRDGMTPEQKRGVANLLRKCKALGATRALHGGCVGADTDFHGMAKDRGFLVLVYPSDLPQYLHGKYQDADHIARKDPPLVRNARIVQEAQVMIGCPKGEEKTRSGTWHALRRCQAFARGTFVFYPDGLEEVWNPSTPYVKRLLELA